MGNTLSQKKKDKPVNEVYSNEQKKSLLPWSVKEILQEGMNEGIRSDFFGDGSMNLSACNIKDSMMPELCDWLIKLNGKVKILNLSANKMTADGASVLFDSLRASNSSIKKVLLINNSKQIRDECMKSLGEYIKSNKLIEGIWLGHNDLTDIGIEILEPYLHGNTTFKNLDLSGNKGITDKSIPLLLKTFELSYITNIDVDNTSISQKNAFTVPLTCNKIKDGLEIIDLRKSNLNDKDLIQICGTMKKYGIKKLKELVLETNNITSKGASVLFDTLNECDSVVSRLNLLQNQFDDDCFNSLAEYLRNDEHLETLDLGYAKVSDKGIEILSEQLIGNTKLRWLHVGGNKGITDASASHLIEVAKGSCIGRIFIENTSISARMKQEIQQTLCIHYEKRDVPIKSNAKSAAKISAYA